MARRKSDSDGFIFKTGLFAILAGLAFWIFNQFGGKKSEPELDPVVNTEQSAPRPTPTVPDDILPTSSTGEIVRHTYYTLSYVEDHEQAEWVEVQDLIDTERGTGGFGHTGTK